MWFGKDVIRFDTTLCDSFNTLCGLGIIKFEFEFEFVNFAVPLRFHSI